MQRTGDKGRSLLDRFLARVIPEPNSGCWLWDGSAEGSSGKRPIMRFGKTKRMASRVSHDLFKGPIPKGLNALHTCDTPMCVNPDHIYAGTQAQNMADAIKRKRHITKRHPNIISNLGKIMGGRNKGRSKLSSDQIVEFKRRLDDGEMIKDLSVEFGVGRAFISRYKNFDPATSQR